MWGEVTGSRDKGSRVGGEGDCLFTASTTLLGMKMDSQTFIPFPFWFCRFLLLGARHCALNCVSVCVQRSAARSPQIQVYDVCNGIV